MCNTCKFEYSEGSVNCIRGTGTHRIMGVIQREILGKTLSVHLCELI